VPIDNNYILSVIGPNAEEARSEEKMPFPINETLQQQPSLKYKFYIEKHGTVNAIL